MTSLNVSPGKLLREQGGVCEGETQEAAEEEADCGGWGGVQERCWSSRRHGGEGKSCTRAVWSANFFSCFSFPGKEPHQGREENRQRGRRNQLPLWITLASEPFPGRASLRINVVVNLWRLSSGEGTLLFFCYFVCLCAFSTDYFFFNVNFAWRARALIVVKKF